MPKIKPFSGYLVKPEKAGTVVSPAYDSISAEQRKNFAETNPDNFINTMRMLEDFPEDRRPTEDELLHANRQQLDKLLLNGFFETLQQPCMFVYQLGSDHHLQTGLICEVPISEYENGTLRKHENTHSIKENLLSKYLSVVGAASSPICLTYPNQSDIDSLIDTITANAPDLDFVTEDGEPQKIWRVEDPAVHTELQSLFKPIEATYLTDGHHRAASSLRYAEIKRAEDGTNTGDEPFNQLLIALFPDNQLNLLPFHRCLKDKNGLTTEQIISALESCFDVKPLGADDRAEPSDHGEFGMFIDQSWFRLRLKRGSLKIEDAVTTLDVSVLQDLILNPVFGIKDSRSDARLGYIAGVTGDMGIAQAISEGWQVIFVCHPTSITQLMDVADSNALMPPKSTYFDPKPRSGIFLRQK